MPPLWICTNISKLNIWCFLVNYRTDLVSQNGFEPFTNPCRVELLAMCVALTVDGTMAWRLGIEPRTYGFGIRCSTNWTTSTFVNWLTSKLVSFNIGSGYAPNCLDVQMINHKTLGLVLPHIGIEPILYVYRVTSPSWCSINSRAELLL